MWFFEGVLDPIKEVQRSLGGELICIDNFVFKLFYQVTVSSLLIFSIILSIGQVCQEGNLRLALIFVNFCC